MDRKKHCTTYDRTLAAIDAEIMQALAAKAAAEEVVEALKKPYRDLDAARQRLRELGDKRERVRLERDLPLQDHARPFINPVRERLNSLMQNIRGQVETDEPYRNVDSTGRALRAIQAVIPRLDALATSSVSDPQAEALKLERSIPAVEIDAPDKTRQFTDAFVAPDGNIVVA